MKANNSFFFLSCTPAYFRNTASQSSAKKRLKCSFSAPFFLRFSLSPTDFYTEGVGGYELEKQKKNLVNILGQQWRRSSRKTYIYIYIYLFIYLYMRAYGERERYRRVRSTLYALKKKIGKCVRGSNCKAIAIYLLYRCRYECFSLPPPLYLRVSGAAD